MYENNKNFIGIVIFTDFRGRFLLFINICRRHARFRQFIGASLAPLIFGETSFEKKYISSESKPVNINPDKKDIEEYAVRNERYKLVWHKYNTAQPFELYDLQNDPKEEKNLINDLPEIAEELKAQLPSYIDWR